MSDITLLDGSIGQELVRRSGAVPTPLWSTTVMMEQPALLGALHRDYLDAGASVISTNTYAVHRDRLAPEGMEDRFESLLETALSSARQARGDRPARIAGVLGPLGASYRPDLAPAPETAAAAYREIVARLAPGVDLFVIETAASLRQADGALQGTSGCGRPVWLAVTVADDDGTRLRSGEPVADLDTLVQRHAPDAVLVNCSRPEAVGDALDILRGFGRPFGAYANGFTGISAEFLKDRPTVDALQARTDLDPAAYADFAMSWVAQGATIVGGCCEIGPAHIAELARRLRADGHRIV